MMTEQTKRTNLPNSLTILTGQVPSPGEVADAQARIRVFARYRQDKAPQSLRRQKAALNLFATYLGERELKTTGEALADDPAAWSGITWGLVEGWLAWLLDQGYAVGTVNVRLSTVKTYAELALKAGAISGEQYGLIRAVKGFSRKAGRNVDEARRQAGQETRQGRKKAEPRLITPSQAQALKHHPNTPQGRRDALMMCLLLDHGLRCGEVAGLTVADLNLKTGELRFYRPKVHKTQTHELTTATLQAAQAYFETGDAPPLGPLLRESRKSGRLTQPGLSVQAITARVKTLGEALGIDSLSAHDCRHYWATQAARAGTDPFSLQEAGGWASLAMPRRYVEAAKIANQGVKLE